MNCESIEVESNAGATASSVDMTGLASLESIDIGDDSCNSLTEVIVGSTVFSLLSNVTIGSNSLNTITAFPPSLTASIRSLNIGSNSLISVKELSVDESSELESVSIGEGSLSGVDTLVLNNITSQSRRLSDWRSRTGYYGLSAFGLSFYGTGYTFSLNSMSVLRNVKKIEVRENAFHNINRFEVNGLSKLESIVIGRNSIHGREGEGAFIIEGCSSIHTISMGEDTFVQYQSLGLKNCDNLREFRRGKKTFASVRSIEMRAISITSFEIGHSEFTHLESLTLDGMSRLTKLAIGEGNGVNDIENEQFMITNCDVLDNMIIEEGSFKFFSEVRIEKNLKLREMEFGPWCFNRAHDVGFIGRYAIRM